MHQREDAVVARLQGLAPHLDGEPDPAFRDATRARLVAMAAVRTPEPAPATGLQRLLAVRAPDIRPSRWRARLTAGLAGAALTVTALAGLVAVAEGARPGDLLYDLKRGTEQSQLAVAGDARGQTLLDFAGTRLDEIEELVGGDPALVLETLRTMDEQTAEGAVWLTGRAVGSGNARPLDDLAAWAAVQSGELAALQPRMPEEAGAAAVQSLALLTEVGARTDALGTALACPGGPVVAGTDRLGPVPAPCPTPEPAPPVVSGGTTEPGTGAVPEPTAPAGAVPGESTVPGQSTVPGRSTDPSAPVPGVPGTSTELSTPSVRVPVPTATPGGGAVPSPPLPQLPLPGTTGDGAVRTSTSPPVVELPPTGSITLCLPPLATVGNC